MCRMLGGSWHRSLHTFDPSYAPCFAPRLQEGQLCPFRAYESGETLVAIGLTTTLIATCPLDAGCTSLSAAGVCRHSSSRAESALGRATTPSKRASAPSRQSAATH